MNNSVNATVATSFRMPAELWLATKTLSSERSLSFNKTIIALIDIGLQEVAAKNKNIGTRRKNETTITSEYDRDAL